MHLLSDYACKVCLQRLSKISVYEARFLLPKLTLLKISASITIETRTHLKDINSN
jgi:hypothetical protein